MLPQPVRWLACSVISVNAGCSTQHQVRLYHFHTLPFHSLYLAAFTVPKPYTDPPPPSPCSSGIRSNAEPWHAFHGHDNGASTIPVTYPTATTTEFGELGKYTTEGFGTDSEQQESSNDCRVRNSARTRRPTMRRSLAPHFNRGVVRR